MYLAEFAFVSVHSIFSPMLLFYEGYIVLVSHPNTNPADSELWYYKAVRCSEDTLKLVVKRSCEGTRKLSTCQPRSQCFSLLLYLLFFRDWNAVVHYHSVQCLLIFCNTYHRQPSVCFTEASRLNFIVVVVAFLSCRPTASNKKKNFGLICNFFKEHNFFF